MHLFKYLILNISHEKHLKALPVNDAQS